MQHALRSLFPETVQVVELSDPALLEPLYPEEEAVVARAVEKRKVEFALGRTAARRALARLGVAPCALPQNRDRSVAWPERVWGSITHAEQLVVAVATLRADHPGIGVDAELRGRVKRELWTQIATAREIAWCEQAEGARAASERATLLFSAKEAFYKAQFCRSRAWVGFLDVELRVDDPACFELTLQVDVGGVFARGQRFQGRYVTTASHVLTGVVLP